VCTKSSPLMEALEHPSWGPGCRRALGLHPRVRARGAQPPPRILQDDYLCQKCLEKHLLVHEAGAQPAPNAPKRSYWFCHGSRSRVHSSRKKNFPTPPPKMPQLLTLVWMKGRGGRRVEEEDLFKRLDGGGSVLMDGNPQAAINSIH
jgi:hypothetical protein